MKHKEKKREKMKESLDTHRHLFKSDSSAELCEFQSLDGLCSLCVALQLSVVLQLGANRKAAQPGAAFTEYAMLSGFGRLRTPAWRTGLEIASNATVTAPSPFGRKHPLLDGSARRWG
jgi:hypothetical protein